MPWDVPDEGGSKGPEEPEEGRKTSKLWTSRNLETGQQHILSCEETVDKDTGRKNMFFRILGKDNKNLVRLLRNRPGRGVNTIKTN